MERVKNAMASAFVCSSAIVCVIFASFGSETLSEHSEVVFGFWIGGLLLVISDSLGVFMGGPMKYIRSGVDAGRHQERLKIKNGWTEERLQEELSKTNNPFV